MTNKEFALCFIKLIHHAGGAQQALKAVQASHAPYKQRKFKKQLCKLIRTYAYITNNKEEEQETRRNED